jgi:hypothetical protein
VDNEMKDMRECIQHGIIVGHTAIGRLNRESMVHVEIKSYCKSLVICSKMTFDAKDDKYILFIEILYFDS